MHASSGLPVNDSSDDRLHVFSPGLNEYWTPVTNVTSIIY